MILGIEWFWETAAGYTAMLLVLCCFFAGVFQWTRFNRKIDKTGYVRMASGPFGLFPKDVPLSKVPKEVLEGIIASLKAAGQEPPKALLQAASGLPAAGMLPNGPPGEPAAGNVFNTPIAAVEVLPHETKEAGNSSGVSASANSGSPEAPMPPTLIEATDPELAEMLKPHAQPAEQQGPSIVATAATETTAPQAAPTKCKAFYKNGLPCQNKICRYPKQGLCDYHYGLVRTKLAKK